MELSGLEQHQMVHRSLRMYDQSPNVAEKFFGDISDNPLAINDRFGEISTKFEGPSKQVFFCGYNYALISALFRNGNSEVAGQLLERITEGDLPIELLDYLLKKVEDSFPALCVRHREFIIPKKLDELVFAQYAPEFQFNENTFYSKDGVVVAIEQDNDYDCTIGVLEHRRFAAISANVSTSVFAMAAEDKGGLGRFRFRGERDSLTAFIQENLAREGISDYSLVFSNKAGFEYYAPTRFIIYKSGALGNGSYWTDVVKSTIMKVQLE